MTVKSTHLRSGFAFEVQAGSFIVPSDVAEKLGGAHSAPDPHEYLEAALAACTAITLQMYAQRKGIPLIYADVSITITAEGTSNEILREIILKGDLSPDQRASLLSIAERCPIHKFLSKGASIVSRLKDEAAHA